MEREEEEGDWEDEDEEEEEEEEGLVYTRNSHTNESTWIARQKLLSGSLSVQLSQPTITLQQGKKVGLGDATLKGEGNE